MLNEGENDGLIEGAKLGNWLNVGINVGSSDGLTVGPFEGD
jgi:hypothetical protein